VLLAPGFDANLKEALVAAIDKEGATAAIIARIVGGVQDSAGKKHPAQMALAVAGVPGLAKRANVMGVAGVAEFGGPNDIAGFRKAAARD
jgi:hypothetical protein